MAIRTQGSRRAWQGDSRVVRGPDPWLPRVRRVIAQLFGAEDDRGFAVRYWDALLETPHGAVPPAFTLILSGPGSVRRMLLPPSELRLAQAFISGVCDIEGDLVAASVIEAEVRRRLGRLDRWPKLIAELARLPRYSPGPSHQTLGRAAPGRATRGAPFAAPGCRCGALAL